MKLRRNITALLLLVSLLCTKGFSQTTYTVKGRITDASTGDPIPFANIGIRGQLGGTTTNFDGIYELK